MFRKMMRDQGSDCLRYVNEAARIHVSADYRRDEASGMTYQYTEIVTYMTPQISRYSSLSSLENIFGSYQPQPFENAPNFTSSPVPMSIDIHDAINNLKNLNTAMEDIELDDANNEVNGNDPEDASKGCDITIKHGEHQRKRSLQLLLSFVGLGVTILTSTPKRKKQKSN
ncbi:hypothetical protein P3S67_003216 [Capsicum chacoense]